MNENLPNRMALIVCVDKWSWSDGERMNVNLPNKMASIVCVDK